MQPQVIVTEVKKIVGHFEGIVASLVKIILALIGILQFIEKATPNAPAPVRAVESDTEKFLNAADRWFSLLAKMGGPASPAPTPNTTVTGSAPVDLTPPGSAPGGPAPAADTSSAAAGAAASTTGPNLSDVNSAVNAHSAQLSIQDTRIANLESALKTTIAALQHKVNFIDAPTRKALETLPGGGTPGGPGAPNAEAQAAATEKQDEATLAADEAKLKNLESGGTPASS